MPYLSKAQQRLFHSKGRPAGISEEDVKEWDQATKAQKGGFAALPKKKHASESSLSELLNNLEPQPPLSALLEKAGQEADLADRSPLKFAFNRMVAPALQRQRPTVGTLGSALPARNAQVQPTAAAMQAAPQQAKPVTLGGNTPTMNPIGLLGQISTTPGKITGNSSFTNGRM